MTGMLTDPSGLDCPLGADRRLHTGTASPSVPSRRAPTVDYQTLGAAGTERCGKQLAEESVSTVCGAGGNDDVTGLNLFDRYASSSCHPDVRAQSTRSEIKSTRVDGRM
jgi:hypothetical protein